jgi:hypothetical protein
MRRSWRLSLSIALVMASIQAASAQVPMSIEER